MRMFLFIGTFVIVLPYNLLAQSDLPEKGVQSRFHSGIGWYYRGFSTNGETSDRLYKYDRVIVNVFYNDWHGDLPAF